MATKYDLAIEAAKTTTIEFSPDGVFTPYEVASLTLLREIRDELRKV